MVNIEISPRTQLKTAPGANCQSNQ